MNILSKTTGLLLGLILIVSLSAEKTIIVETLDDWKAFENKSEGLSILSNGIRLQNNEGVFSSTLKKFKKKTRLKSITLSQNQPWDNWQEVPKVAPQDANDAPVLLPVAPGDYWFFAKKGKLPPKVKPSSNEEPLTEKEKQERKKKRLKNKKKRDRRYHAWHSTDMKTWKHYGPVASNWMTTAEYKDGKFYLYYDNPNDEDPHLITYESSNDLIKGLGYHTDHSMVFEDPSHGSDTAVIRDSKGIFHIIYENWDPINARKHAWDSPLAGHTSSPDGIKGFKPDMHPPAIDVRTTPTGRFSNYVHGTTKRTYQYEIHEGPQDAFGDWTAIQIGSRFYLFCDYDPHDKKKSMRAGRWVSDDIYKTFSWDGEIGKGFHPDPTVGFAEGKFYLLVQRHPKDFISSGPWTGEIAIRIGVDIKGNGKVDQWSEWKTVQETYSQKPGFARVVETKAAQAGFSELPSGKAFQIEIKLQDADKGTSKPVVSRLEASFK